MNEDTARQELWGRATEDWKDLKDTRKDRWEKYVNIGKAIVDAQEMYMRINLVTEPVGPGFQKDMKAWLKERELDDMDKGVRSRLATIINNKAAFDQWYNTLTTAQQMEWNHPNTLYRKWKAHTAITGKDSDEPKPLSATEKLKQSVVDLSEENHRLKREVDRGGGDLWDPSDTNEDIGRVIFGKLQTSKDGKLSFSKVESVARILLRLIKEHTGGAPKPKAKSKAKKGERRGPDDLRAEMDARQNGEASQ